jgi:hypothetical protein
VCPDPTRDYDRQPIHSGRIYVVPAGAAIHEYPFSMSDVLRPEEVEWFKCAELFLEEREA